jgi:SpoVK/Ycf46/Vps4 family AAA+-type ATPase
MAMNDLHDLELMLRSETPILLIESLEEQRILLLDFHPFLEDPLLVRLLKEIAQGLAELPRRLVLISHALATPPELRHLSARFDLRLPDRNRLLTLIRELVRKGRLDEIFFVDLPDAEVRREIFRIHLRRRDLDPDRFDLDRLAEASDGFTGAGIEQAVVSALYAARANQGPPTTSSLIAELEGTQPLSVVMDAQIARLRQWAQGQTVPA